MREVYWQEGRIIGDALITRLRPRFSGERMKSVDNKLKCSLPTLAATLLLLFAVVVKNVDAGPMLVSELVSEDRPASRFGWPFVFAVRTWDITRPLMGEGRFILLDGGSINGVALTTLVVDYRILVGNMLAAVLVLLGAVSNIGQLVRRGKIGPRFSLQALFAFVALIASLAWFYGGRPLWNDVYNLCGVMLLCAVGLAWYAFFSVVGNVLHRPRLDREQGTKPQAESPGQHREGP